jgi:hypothetical protein
MAQPKGRDPSGAPADSHIVPQDSISGPDRRALN